MTDLTELYQSIILDHNRKPRNFREIEDANRVAEGRNPLCGDELKVFLKVDGDTIEDASFKGTGCAISKASASLMTAAIKGKTREEAELLFTRFHELVTGKIEATTKDPVLGSLAVFAGVSRFPVRVKCASLSWHTMSSALHAGPARVSTE